MRILIVEDNQKMGAFLEHGLRGEHFEADRASDGVEAIAKAGSVDYDLILLDHMVLKKSRTDIATRLRAQARRTPILMLTARDVPEDFRPDRPAGVNDIMGKPFYFDDLLNRIRALLPEAGGKLTNPNGAGTT